MVDIVPPAGRGPMITFKGGGFSGSVSCSTFQVRQVAIDPPRMKIDDMSVAGVECPDRSPQPLVEAFFRALGRAEFIELDGVHLVLKGAEGALVFEQILGSH